MRSDFSEDYVSNYLEEVFGETAKYSQDAVYDLMNRYDEAWWEFEDNRLRAGYQVFEDVLIIPLEEYKEGLSSLLSRPVSSAELERNKQQLQEEVREAIPQLEELGLLYRENDDIHEKQVSGLEESVDAAKDVVDELSEKLDFEIKEESSKDGSDFRIN